MGSWELGIYHVLDLKINDWGGEGWGDGSNPSSPHKQLKVRIIMYVTADWLLYTML